MYTVSNRSSDVHEDQINGLRTNKKKLIGFCPLFNIERFFLLRIELFFSTQDGFFNLFE